MADAPVQERRLHTLTPTALGRLGEALAEQDGKPVFVQGALPGEKVLAEVVRERRDHIAARVVQVLDASPNRVEPACPHFGACTGCQWQHVSYPHQLALKRERVVEALERVGGITEAPVRETLGSEPLGYRNHARFTVSREGGRLGFVNRETRLHVEVDRCPLMAESINQTLAALQGHAAETTQLSVRVGVGTGDMLVQPALHDPALTLPTGQKHYTEEMGGHRFQVSSPSFFQVNTAQAERMAALVTEALGPAAEGTVADAYAGVATFAVLLAGRAKRVLAVEESASALADARVNVAGLPNVELRQARTEDVLAEMAANAEGGLDGVVLDPPRTGCMPGTLDALLAHPAPRIAYVSCDPDSLARDLAVLTAGPYRIEWVAPVDMFPQTHHVEAVVALALDESKRGALAARAGLILASSSPRRVDIMARLGLDALAAPTDVPEPTHEHEGADPVALAEARALAKANAAAAGFATGTVIGSDTVVALDGNVLGKPADPTEASAMLKALAGREHKVITAVALVDAAGRAEPLVVHRSTRVRMRAYTAEEMDAYIATGDPFDKAGGYAIQHQGFHPVAEVRGCHLNVVGLPVCALLRALERFGLRPHPAPALPWPELEACPECAKRAGVPKRRRPHAGGGA
ncbi:MAG: Maf family nucleotide pyrophosphatase [Chloroflexota bacterium]